MLRFIVVVACMIIFFMFVSSFSLSKVKIILKEEIKLIHSFTSLFHKLNFHILYVFYLNCHQI